MHLKEVSASLRVGLFDDFCFKKKIVISSPSLSWKMYYYMTSVAGVRQYIWFPPQPLSLKLFNDRKDQVKILLSNRTGILVLFLPRAGEKKIVQESKKWKIPELERFLPSKLRSGAICWLELETSLHIIRFGRSIQRRGLFSFWFVWGFFLPPFCSPIFNYHHYMQVSVIHPCLFWITCFWIFILFVTLCEVALRHLLLPGNGPVIHLI